MNSGLNICSEVLPPFEYDTLLHKIIDREHDAGDYRELDLDFCSQVLSGILPQAYRIFGLDKASSTPLKTETWPQFNFHAMNSEG